MFVAAPLESTAVAWEPPAVPVAVTVVALVLDCVVPDVPVDVTVLPV